MTDEKWIETVYKIKEKFLVYEEGREDIQNIPKAFKEFIIFQSPLGKIRLERITQPVVLGTKTHYSKLAGKASKIEYIYSDSEMYSKIRIFKWNEAKSSWEELTLPKDQSALF